jgi:hypothetical protein
MVKYTPRKEDRMKSSFYGREEQIADLERLWGKRTGISTQSFRSVAYLECDADGTID